MVRELSDPWNTFERVLGDRSNFIATFINDALDSVANHLGKYLPYRHPRRVLIYFNLDDLPDGYDSSILPLHHALTSCQRLLATEVEDLCDLFESRVS